jgi:iron(III) transport system substrate-binding protein
MSRRTTGKRVTKVLSGALCASLGVTACGSSKPAAQVSSGVFGPSTSTACAAGAKEGTLNYWSRTDASDFDKEIAPFRAKYPQIKVNFTSITPTDATQKIITETQANHALDVDATSTDLASAQPLFDQKLVKDVKWSALGIPGNLLLTYGGVGTFRTLRDFVGIGYNPKLVAAADVPTSWDQLVNSKYSGRVIVDPRGIYLSGLAVAWGESKTTTWFDNLLKTSKPQVVQGATSSIEKVVSGEALFTTSATTSAINAAKGSGAPIAIAYLDVVPSQDKYGVILTKALHPNAAACFLGWFGSAEGQAQQLKVEFKGNADQPVPMPSGAALSVASTVENQNVQNAVSVKMGTALSK